MRRELHGVDRAPLSRRVQRKRILRTPEPVEKELFQSRRRPGVRWLVEQIARLVRIFAVVVQAPAPGVRDRVGETIGPDAASETVAAWSFVIGVLLFSGSLYALALTGVRRWGIVTPFGALAFLVGWAAFVVAAATATFRFR